jgi:hypothetical protein
MGHIAAAVKLASAHCAGCRPEGNILRTLLQARELKSQTYCLTNKVIKGIIHRIKYTATWGILMLLSDGGVGLNIWRRDKYKKLLNFILGMDDEKLKKNF